RSDCRSSAAASMISACCRRPPRSNRCSHGRTSGRSSTEPRLMHEAIHAFLLGFPALFSIVNPLAGAFIFREMTIGRSVEQRGILARKVATYALLMMMAALWAGSFVLAFFGITLAALRIAGGMVVALTAWNL